MPDPNQDTIREFLQDTKRFAAWILKYCEEKKDHPRQKYFESFRYRLNLETLILEPKPENAHPDKTMQLEYEPFGADEATAMIRLNGKYKFIRKDTISKTADEYAYFFENLLTDRNMILDFTISHVTEHERRKSYEYLIKAWSQSFFPTLIDYLYIVDGVEPGASVKMYMLDSFKTALNTLCDDIDTLDTVIIAAYKLIPKRQQKSSEITDILTDRKLHISSNEAEGAITTVVSDKYFVRFTKPRIPTNYIELSILAVNTNIEIIYRDTFDCIDIKHMCEVLDNIIENDIVFQWFNTLMDVEKEGFRVNIGQTDLFCNAKMKISSSTYILVHFTFDTRNWCKCKVVKNDVIPNKPWRLIADQAMFFKHVAHIKKQDTDPSQH